MWIWSAYSSSSSGSIGHRAKETVSFAKGNSQVASLHRRTVGTELILFFVLSGLMRIDDRITAKDLFDLLNRNTMPGGMLPIAFVPGYFAQLKYIHIVCTTEAPEGKAHQRIDGLFSVRTAVTTGV
jgi:hypothetical protein